MSAYLAINGENAIAQRDSTKLNQDVEVIKPYKPSISNANKINQLPVIEDTTRFKPEFDYSIESRPITSGFKSGTVSIQEINTQTEKDAGIGYLKLGAGLYNTTYGELSINNNKSKNGIFGLRLRHLASDATRKLTKGDKVDAPYSQNHGEIFGSGLIGSTTLWGNISYDRDAFRFYGYPDTIPVNISESPLFDTKQHFQKAKIEIGLKSNENGNSKLGYKTGLWYHFFDTKTEQKENAFGLSGNFDYQFTKFKGLLETSYEHFTTKGIADDDYTAGWLKIAPSILLSGDRWSLNGGLTLYSASETVGDYSLKMYPDLDFTYLAIPDIMTLYAGVNGYLQNSNYSAIAYENNWINPEHLVRNTDHQYVLTAGLKGLMTSEISYQAGLKYEKVNSMHFYMLTSPGTSAPFIYNNFFDVVYDDMEVFNLSAEISYIKGKDYNFSLKGNYFNYRSFGLAFAPHMPRFELQASGGFRIVDKVSGFSDLKITGQRDALIRLAAGDRRINLEPIVLLNLGAEYELKPTFKIFGRIDNLLNQRYEQWLGYTSQGARLIAGISFSF